MSDESKKYAFPSQVPVEDESDFSYGIKVRDYFAGRAMEGIVSTYTNSHIMSITPVEIIAVSTIAFMIADTMLTLI